MTAPAQETPIEELLAGYFAYSSLDQLADAAVAAVLNLWSLLGELPRDELRDAVVDVLTAWIVQAEAVGRVAGVRDADRPVDGLAIVPNVADRYRRAPVDFEQRSAIAPPLPDAVRADPYFVEVRDEELRERLAKAIDTVLDEYEQQVEAERRELDEERRAVAFERERESVTLRVERIARDEPIQAAQRGYQDGLRAAGPTRVKPILGYRRRINPDACELCYWLWKEGYVYPIDQPMHRHTGCRCVPVPTTDPVGKWKLSPADEALFESLYEKYSAPRNERKRARRQQEA